MRKLCASSVGWGVVLLENNTSRVSRVLTIIKQEESVTRLFSKRRIVGTWK